MSYFKIIALCFIFAQCERESDTCHKSINFVNNYSKLICVNSYAFYPDTLLSPYSGSIKGNESCKVYSGETNKTALVSRECIEKELSGSAPDRFPVDTIMVFIFDAELLESNTWKNITSNYMILRRYDLSLQDLQNLNWTLYYPPTEAMKDIKMYPPYGQ